MCRSTASRRTSGRARGLVRSFQQVELFDDLDVRGQPAGRGRRRSWWTPLADLVAPRRAGPSRSLDRAVDLLGIGHLLDRTAAELSEGERKLVGLCRALAAGAERAAARRAGRRPRHRRERGARRPGSGPIVDAGTAVLLVDHDMGLVLERVRPRPRDRARRAHRQRPARRGPPATSGSSPPTSGSGARHDALLEVEGLRAGYGRTVVVRDLSLTVEPGEVVALLGPNGAGKTTTLMTIAGLLPRARRARSGASARRWTPRSPHRNARRGLGLVTEDRSLFPGLTVRENLRLGARRPAAWDEVGPWFPALDRAARPAGRPAVRRRAADARPGPRPRRAGPASCWSTR